MSLATATQLAAPEMRVARLISRIDLVNARTVAIAVVVHNPQRVQLVLRVCFGCTAGTTLVLPFKKATPGSEVYHDAVQFQAAYGADPSNMVLVIEAHHPVKFAAEQKTLDGVVPVFVEMFTKENVHLRSVPCGATYCPAAHRPWETALPSTSSTPESLPDAADPAELAVPPPPELLPSSSSSATSSESASPPDLAIDPPFSPNVTMRSGSQDVEVGFSAETPSYSPQMTFMRSTLVPTKAHAVQAVLVLKGDVANMALGWKMDELAAKRRLVYFESCLQGPQVVVKFWAISQDDYTALPTSKGATVISCIYDEERDECVATSVDILHLLEVILYSEFGIDERNRIRRNLEGLRPKAIAKSQADTETLFSLIMEFPYPKPRSIEKSLKVFKWSALEAALNKIITKFSAVHFGSPPPAIAPFKSKAVRDCAAAAPYPSRSPKQANPRYATRRNARSPQFVTPEPRSPLSEDEQSQQATPMAAAAGPSEAAPVIHVIQVPGPVLVQSDDDDARARIPSVNLPALHDPSPCTSPPLPQQSQAAGTMLSVGERPRNASFDRAMFMPVDHVMHDQPHPAFDFDDASVIDHQLNSDTHSSPPHNMSALGLFSSPSANAPWGHAGWSSGPTSGTNVGPLVNLNYASSSLANALGQMS